VEKEGLPLLAKRVDSVFPRNVDGRKIICRKKEKSFISVQTLSGKEETSISLRSFSGLATKACGGGGERGRSPLTKEVKEGRALL